MSGGDGRDRFVLSLIAFTVALFMVSFLYHLASKRSQIVCLWNSDARSTGVTYAAGGLYGFFLLWVVF